MLKLAHANTFEHYQYFKMEGKLKRQIRRLSPHQNGKVAGILMAITTLPLLLIMMVPMIFMMPKVDQAGNPVEIGFPFAMILIMPIIYLVFTYIGVAFGSLVYNLLFPLIGGFELEIYQDEEDDDGI